MTDNALPTLDEDYLEFIREEGLDLLALFRQIRERSKRDLVVDLVRALVEAQSDTNGGT